MQEREALGRKKVWNYICKRIHVHTWDKGATHIWNIPFSRDSNIEIETEEIIIYLKANLESESK